MQAQGSVVPVQGLGFWAWGLWFEIWGFGFGV